MNIDASEKCARVHEICLYTSPQCRQTLTHFSSLVLHLPFLWVLRDYSWHDNAASVRSTSPSVLQRWGIAWWDRAPFLPGRWDLWSATEMSAQMGSQKGRLKSRPSTPPETLCKPCSFPILQALCSVLDWQVLGDWHLQPAPGEEESLSHVTFTQAPPNPSARPSCDPAATLEKIHIATCTQQMLSECFLVLMMVVVMARVEVLVMVAELWWPRSQCWWQWWEMLS